VAPARLTAAQRYRIALDRADDAGGKKGSRERMIEGVYLVTLMGTLLVLLAAFSSLLAFRFGAPLLLLFLGIGLLAGVDGLGIAFDNAGAAYFVCSLALAIILFDSGFGTPIQTFRQAAGPAVTLATAGVLLTAAVFALAAHFLLGLGWVEAFLLGAIVAPTDAAAVFFLLRIGGINIRDRVRATLEVESGSNDPMAIFLTIALVEILSGGEGANHAGLELVLEFFMEMTIGILAGLGGGWIIVALVGRVEMERGLTPIFVLALSLLVFSATGAIHGSGFLAVYVAGLYAGNSQMRAAASLRRFQDGMSWLAQIIMFLILGLLATPSQFSVIALPAIALALFLIFVARPVAIWFCLLPFSFPRQENAFLSWVGLRGAVSILLAIVPLLGGLENAMVFFNSAFIIVLVSLLIQGWTTAPLARRLGLVVPARIGPVDKVELELPGSAHHELLAYRVVPDSPVAKGERIPRWARPSLVIRDGQSMRYQYAGRLRAGDHVYLFISPRYPRLLDRLFASPAPVEGDDADFFGAFAIDPRRPARDLQLAYGPELREDELDLTIAELMKARLGGRAEYADRVPVGPVELIVRDVDQDGAITSVGVSLEPEAAQPQIPIYLSLQNLIAGLLGWVVGRAPPEAPTTGEEPAPGPAERSADASSKEA
jgi:cell volume regulation protein A